MHYLLIAVYQVFIFLQFFFRFFFNCFRFNAFSSVFFLSFSFFGRYVQFHSVLSFSFAQNQKCVQYNIHTLVYLCQKGKSETSNAESKTRNFSNFFFLKKFSEFFSLKSFGFLLNAKAKFRFGNYRKKIAEKQNLEYFVTKATRKKIHESSNQTFEVNTWKKITRG